MGVVYPRPNPRPRCPDCGRIHRNDKMAAVLAACAYYQAVKYGRGSVTVKRGNISVTVRVK